jgi:hypothetical protein
MINIKDKGIYEFEEIIFSETINLYKVLATPQQINEKLNEYIDLVIISIGNQLRSNLLETIKANKNLYNRLYTIFRTYLRDLAPYHREPVHIGYFIRTFKDEITDPVKCKEFSAFIGHSDVSNMPLSEIKHYLELRKNCKEFYGDKYQNTLKFVKTFDEEYGFYAQYPKDKLDKYIEDKIIEEKDLKLFRDLYNFNRRSKSKSHPSLEKLMAFIPILKKSTAYQQQIQFITPNKFEIDDVTFEVTEKQNPINLILGNITVCCQTLGGQAETCVLEGLINPHAGFLAVYETSVGIENGLLYQSFIWESGNKENKKLILDNIEHCQKNLNDKSEEYIDQIKVNYKTWAEYMKATYGYDGVLMGVGYGKLAIGEEISPTDRKKVIDSRIRVKEKDLMQHLKKFVEISDDWADQDDDDDDDDEENEEDGGAGIEEEEEEINENENEDAYVLYLYDDDVQSGIKQIANSLRKLYRYFSKRN